MGWWAGWWLATQIFNGKIFLQYYFLDLLFVCMSVIKLCALVFFQELSFRIPTSDAKTLKHSNIYCNEVGSKKTWSIRLQNLWVIFYTSTDDMFVEIASYIRRSRRCFCSFMIYQATHQQVYKRNITQDLLGSTVCLVHNQRRASLLSLFL